MARAPAGRTASRSTATALSRTRPTCLTATQTRSSSKKTPNPPLPNHRYHLLSTKRLFLVGLLRTPKRCFNFSILFRIFCDSVLSRFFCTDNDDSEKKKKSKKTHKKNVKKNLIKSGWLVGTKGHQMLSYCCRHPSRIIRPVASVLEMRCREYLRLFYILVVFMYVYTCIYPYASPLEYTIPFYKFVPLVRLCRLFFSLFFFLTCGTLILNIMCWLIQLKTRCQEHTKLRLIFLMSNAF